MLPKPGIDTLHCGGQQGVRGFRSYVVLLGSELKMCRTHSIVSTLLGDLVPPSCCHISRGYLVGTALRKATVHQVLHQKTLLAFRGAFRGRARVACKLLIFSLQCLGLLPSPPPQPPHTEYIFVRWKENSTKCKTQARCCGTYQLRCDGLWGSGLCSMLQSCLSA